MKDGLLNFHFHSNDFSLQVAVNNVLAFLHQLFDIFLLEDSFQYLVIWKLEYMIVIVKKILQQRAREQPDSIYFL